MRKWSGQSFTAGTNLFEFNFNLMSVTVTYYRLPPAERESVMRDQPSWEEFRRRLRQEHQKAFNSAMAVVEGFQGSREEIFAKLNALLREGRDPRRFDMEKDWHTLGYLFTGSSEIAEEHREDAPLHSVIFGGLMSPVTTGYGPARYFDEHLVGQMVRALRGADRELIARRFDPARMAELDIYAAPVEAEREVIILLIEKFTVFFEEAATAGENVMKFAT